MNIISRKWHAFLDYLSGIVLIGAPWIFDFYFSHRGAAAAVLAGVFILILSIITDYEGGLIRMVPMSMHLNMDILLGILLAVSPWLFGFRYEVYLPHLLMGLLALFAGILTMRRSLSEKKYTNQTDHKSIIK